MVGWHHQVSRIHWNYVAAWLGCWAGLLFTLQDFTFCDSQVKTGDQFNILTQQSQLLGQSDWSNLTLWEPNILLTFTFRQLEEN